MAAVFLCWGRDAHAELAGSAACHSCLHLGPPGTRWQGPGSGAQDPFLSPPSHLACTCGPPHLLGRPEDSGSAGLSPVPRPALPTWTQVRPETSVRPAYSGAGTSSFPPPPAPVPLWVVWPWARDCLSLRLRLVCEGLKHGVHNLARPTGVAEKGWAGPAPELSVCTVLERGGGLLG